MCFIGICEFLKGKKKEDSRQKESSGIMFNLTQTVGGTACGASLPWGSQGGPVALWCGFAFVLGSFPLLSQ